MGWPWQGGHHAWSQRLGVWQGWTDVRVWQEWIDVQVWLESMDVSVA